MSATCPSRSTEKRVSQWEELMRKFSEAHKEECKTVSLDIPQALRSTKQFPTGSQYEGSWDVLGMSGYGTYTFPNGKIFLAFYTLIFIFLPPGVMYVGQFDDGMFHGEGELRYPHGEILRGKWRKGTMIERTLYFANGLKYVEYDWPYCRMPDRRFAAEYDNGIHPAGQSYLTADQPTRDIPARYYDTGDGFYDPKTKMVYAANDTNSIIRSPSLREQKWIVENCRTSPEMPLGPRPDLYEEWSEPVVDGPAPETTDSARSFQNFYTQEMEE
ncbi:putative radial spoke head 1-like protein, partial [Operophtera brumata]